MKRTSKLLGIIVLTLVFSLIGCGGGSGDTTKNNPVTGGDTDVEITELVISSSGGLSVKLGFPEGWIVGNDGSDTKSQFKLSIDGVNYLIITYSFSYGEPISIGHSCIFEDENHITQVGGTEYKVKVEYTQGEKGLFYDLNKGRSYIPSFTVEKDIVATAAP
jgi:hypothetical protein